MQQPGLFGFRPSASAPDRLEEQSPFLFDLARQHVPSGGTAAPLDTAERSIPAAASPSEIMNPPNVPHIKDSFSFMTTASRGFNSFSNGQTSASFSFPGSSMASSSLSPILNGPTSSSNGYSQKPGTAGQSTQDGQNDGSDSESEDQNGSTSVLSNDRTSGKRKASSSTKGATESNAGDEPPRVKKKRNRAVLSCVPCKARKIKCDRMLPCESCVKRGMTAECRWEDLVKVPPPQPFASSAEVADLARRLKIVEEQLALLPENTLTLGIKRAGAKAIAAASAVKHPELDEHLDDHDEQQAAVGALEELALGDLVMAARPPQAPMKRSSKHHALCATAPHFHTGSAYASADNTPEGQTPPHRSQSTIFLPAVQPPSVPGLTQFLMETSPAGGLRQVMKALPSREVTNVLWDYYYNEYTWACEYECKIEAQREYGEFWQWIEGGGSIDLIDPAWLAFLFCKLTFAARAAPAEVHERAFGDTTLIDVLPEQFFRASKRCLDIAQWTTKPQFRVFICLLSYINMIFYSLEVTEGLIWQPAAMRLAELLGIHKLGSDPHTMPPWDDLAFPTGPSFRKRQLCCRAWHALLFVDALFSMDFGFSQLRLSDSDTALSLNFNDADLLTEDLTFPGYPMTVHTDGYKDCFRSDIVAIWESGRTDSPSYEKMLEVDAQMCALMDRVPEEVKKAVPSNSSARRSAVVFRCLLTCGIHSQRIKLHMPYMYKSYKNPRYQASHDACIKCAIAVIEGERDYELVTSEQRYWWTYVQVFAAVLCLLLDTLHLTDKQGSGKIVEERLATILLALPIFERGQRTARMSHSRRMGFVGCCVINAMVTAVRERQAAKRENPSQKQETYAQLFERITASLKQATPAEFDSPAAVAAASANTGGRSVANLGRESRLWTDPGASSDLLQSMGISLDSLFGPSTGLQDTAFSNAPQQNGSNGALTDFGAGSAGNSWPTSGVFDELFGGTDLFGAGLAHM